MSFEMEGEAQDPYAEDDQDPVNEPEEVESSVEENGSEAVTPGSEAGDLVGSGVNEAQTDSPDTLGRTPYITDLDVRRQLTVAEMAEALTIPEYHNEVSGNIPYATWRHGTSTGRGRLTIELNEDITHLVEQVTQEFKKQYGNDIYMADVREFALMYGLMHVDELFEMAEAWGLQYD